MAEIRLFGRRWHSSTDSLPVWSIITGLFYFIWFISFFFNAYNLENTGLKYDCDDPEYLRAANYGLMALFFVNGVLDFAVVGVGLRGGPMEPSKRKPMIPMLYIKVLLWICLLGFTAFGTYVVSSPDIGETCWEQNPCVASDGYILTSACKLEDGSGIPQLTPPCRDVFRSAGDFIYCWGDWLALGVTWDHDRNRTGREWAIPQDCNTAAAEVFVEDDPDGGMDVMVVDTTPNDTLSGGGDDPGRELPVGRFMAAVQLELMDQIGLGEDVGPNNVSRSAPWWGCINDTCHDLLTASDKCEQWDILFNVSLPDTTSKKAFFEGLIFSSWGMLGITMAVAWLTFNAFPDYSELESWNGTVTSFADCLCCGQNIKDAAPGTGDPASREIAKSLYMLFGGIDLDPSDRLLGMYLVSEQQVARRQHHVVHALAAAGVALLPKQPGRMRRVWTRMKLMLPGLRQHKPASPEPSAKAAGSSLELAVAGPSRPPLLPGAPASSSMVPPPPPLPPLPSGTLSPDSLTLPSPFDSSPHSGPTVSNRSLAATSVSGCYTTGASPFSAGQGAAVGHANGNPRSLLPMYRHSILRLRTRNMEGAAAEARAALAGDAASLEPAGGSPLKASSSQAGPEGSMGSSLDVWGREAEIKLTHRFHPMLTPSGCTRQLDITPQEAANIYTGYHEPVPKSVLKDAQRISKFAIGAYGLQSIIWGKGQKPAMCMGNINMLVRCLGRPLRIENKFRKRNFSAILGVTGVQPADLLYVSYANAPGGVLPFMIMLHRQSKSVVLAVRGTVSMEDLVTDLLSSPLDVDGWLPDWVTQANGGGGTMYAHAGIVSSATAILKDLEDRGLLEELLYSQLVREGSVRAGAPPEDEAPVAVQAERRFSLGRKLATWHRQQERQQRQQNGGAGLERQPSEEEANVQRQSSDEAGSSAEPDVRGMGPNAEVRLPLRRAKTTIRTKLQLEGWQIVVTGHSLGAAVACMLSFHLKQLFPDLRCWAFNPPGGLLSWNLSQIAQSFCTSVVVGKDVISRLSFSTAKRLVDEMVLSLARCKRPKLVVLADVLLKRRPDVGEPARLCAYEDISDEAVTALEGYHRTSVLHSREAVEMYPPGRLLFLRPFKGPTPQQTVWDAVWIEAPALMGEGILVTPAMMAHHRVFVLSDAFRSVLAGEAAEAEHGEADEEIELPQV